MGMKNQTFQNKKVHSKVMEVGSDKLCDPPIQQILQT